jgi:Ca-activated chloride channel family protein
LDHIDEHEIFEGPMKFLRSELLFVIWAVPVLFVIFFYGMKRRRKILAEFSSNRGLAAIAPEIADNRRWIKALLVIGSLAFMVFALAGPRYGYKWQKIERKGIDIIIAIDCSRSMLATDIRPTRLDRAKREIVDLLNLLKGDRVGLVSFAGTAFLQCPLTLDYEAFYIFLNALTPDFLPVGGTDIAGAVETALAGFNANDNSEKAVILITDGESTGGDPIQAAQKAKAAGVKLFCIGVGKADGAPIPDAGGGFKKDKTGNIVITRLDEETLRQSALLTGGNYVRSVAGDMDLDTIYNRDIRGKTEATTLSSSRKKIWEDRFQWFLLPALLALLVEMFVPEVRRSTLMVVFGLTLLFHHAPAWAANVRQSLQMGQKAYQSGDYDKALKYFIDAQLEDPERPSIYYNIGNANYKKGD